MMKTKVFLAVCLALGLAGVMAPLCGADTNAVGAVKWPPGNYFSAVHTNWPPMPNPPDDRLPVADLGNGRYLVDDRGYVYPKPELPPVHLWFNTNLLAADPRRIQMLRKMLVGPGTATNAEASTQEAIGVLDFWTNHISVLDVWTNRGSKVKR